MLNQQDMEKLKHLSDAQLKNLISVIAEAGGADSRKTAMLMSNTGLLRKNLENMTAAQAESFIDKAGKENAEQIYRIIKNR